MDSLNAERMKRSIFTMRQIIVYVLIIHNGFTKTAV